MVSAVVLAFFLLIGAAVAVVRPFHIGDTPRPNRPGAGPRRNAVEGQARLPVPPDTKLTYQTDAEGGRHYRFESRLSPRGLKVFYRREMPARGWKYDPTFRHALDRARLPQNLLSFTRGPRRCIIYVEESGPFAVTLTVLIVKNSPPSGPSPDASGSGMRNQP